MSEPKKRLNDATPDEWNQAHINWANSNPSHFEKLKVADTDSYEHNKSYYDSDRNKPLNYDETNTDWDNWKPSRTIS